MNIEKARFNMIEQQVKPWKVFDERLLGAMAIIPREQFVPEGHRNLAYADMHIPIGHNQSMLAPREVARMIQALALTGNEKVLEIGCGSGYSSALLSKLARKVYSVDIFADFVNESRQKLSRLAFENVVLEEVDAAQGWLANAPYDAILISSLLPALPESMSRSLSLNGRIVAVLGSLESQMVTLCQLDENGEWRYSDLFPIRTEPMVNAEQPNRFKF